MGRDRRITARDLRAALEREGVTAEISGSAEAAATHLRDIGRADEDCLTFFVGDDPSTLAPLPRCILVCKPGVVPPGGAATRILAENPRLAFYILARAFAPEPPPPGIHPTAVVDPGAKVDPTASVGAYCVLGPCVVGAGSVLHPNVTIYEGVRIGAGVTIEANSSIGVTGQIWAWGEDGRQWVMPQTGGVVIEDGCFIGSNVSIVRGALQDTVIGRGCRIAHGSRIGHNGRLGSGTFVSSGVTVAGSAETGCHSFLGAGSVVQPGVRVGDFNVVGAGTIVNRSFPEDRTIIAGSPARALRKIEPGETLPGVPRIPEAVFRSRAMTTVPVPFRFKGKRTYVQGGDIYNGMMAGLEGLHDLASCTSLQLSMHAFADHHGEMAVGREVPKERNGRPACAELRIVVGGEPIVARLFETSRPVTERNEYDEEKIERMATIEGQEIRIAGDCGYTPIEVAVSLTKQLHYRLFPNPDGKWIFTRLDLRRPLRPEDAAGLAVRFRHNFNDRLTKSELIAGAAPVGHIFFSAAKR